MTLQETHELLKSRAEQASRDLHLLKENNAPKEVQRAVALKVLKAHAVLRDFTAVMRKL